MKTLLALIAFFLLLGGALAIPCPFSSGQVVEYCVVDIAPRERLYNEEMTINVSIGLMRVFEPAEGIEVEINYYNKSGEISRVKIRTDERGITKFTPEIVGYHLVKTCGKGILVYVNTTCGDGVCGGDEKRNTCAQDCGKCGDGICDSNEDLDCVDCAVCGDKICSGSENRSNCIKDCVSCGDDICDYLEDRVSCSQDCEAGVADGACDGEVDGLCDPDCEEESDPDCFVPVETNDTEEVVEISEEEQSVLPYAIIIIVITIAVALSLVEVIRKKSLRLRSGSKKGTKGKGAKKVAKKTPKNKKKSAKKKVPTADEELL